MRQASILGLSAVALLMVGAVGGYQYYQYRFVTVSFASLFAGRDLHQARRDFVIMRSITTGKQEQVYSIAEASVLSSLLLSQDIDSEAKEAILQRQELLRNLRQFYESHPDRRAKAIELFPDLRKELVDE